MFIGLSILSSESEKIKMSNQIESEQATDTEVASGSACSDCYHILNKDHDLDKCYGLDFNGTSWVACKCIKFASEFSIKVSIYENPNPETSSEGRIIPQFKKVS
jgi:hypothetical protein